LVAVLATAPISIQAATNLGERWINREIASNFDADPMSMIYGSLATLVVYIACVLPTSVFRLTLYYRPPLFAAAHELVAYYCVLRGPHTNS